MNKRNGPLKGLTPDGLMFHHHLTEEALLRSLDGELSSRQLAKVNHHLEACWSCRGRRQAIEQSIADLVNYQQDLVAPYLPPPIEQRNIFLARLNALVEELEVEGPSRSWRSALRSWGRRFEPNLVPLTVGAVAVLALLAFLPSLSRPSTVSAKELLRLTTDAENRSIATTVEPVVIQRVRVSVGSASLTRTLYHDVAHHHIKGRVDTRGAVETKGAVETRGAAETRLKAAYSASAVDWDSMLDTASYGHWRATLAHANDRVVQVASDRMRLETTSSTGPVRRAGLTVRTSDYHAIEEDFQLEDQSEIEVAELSYAVVPFASLGNNIFDPAPAPAPVPLPAAVPRAARSMLTSRAELVDAGVAAETALHAVGADLGEQVQVGAADGREIHITGVVKDAQRRQELVAALHAIPHTRLDLLTVDEAAQQATLATAQTAHPVPSRPAEMMVAGPPLLEAELASKFPDKDQRIAYVNQTLSLAQLASARAWALNRLSDRYPAGVVAELSEDARGKLQILLNDHVTALREDLSALQNQLGEILSRSSNTPSANTSVAETGDAGTRVAPDASADWRSRVRRVHSSTEAIHEAVSTLLTSSQPSSAEAIEVNLRTSLTQLQVELLSLDQKIQRPNLQ